MAQANILRDIGEAATPPGTHRAAAEPMLRAVPAPPDVGEPARLLYRATLDLLRWSDDPCAERHFLLEPLGRAVALHKTRCGQQLCQALAEALAARDFDGALDACIRLVEISAPGAPPSAV